MSDDTKRLTEARNKAWNAMSEVLKTASAEGRAMTGEEVTLFTAAEADLNAAGKDIEARERADAVAKIMNAPAPTPGVPSGDPVTPDDRAKETEKVFGRYLRHGLHGIPYEQRAEFELRAAMPNNSGMDTGTANDAGGYLVPQGFLAKITQVQKWFGGARAVANILETQTGNPLVWPANDDTGNPAVIIAQNTAIAQTDLTFTQKTLSAKQWTSGGIAVSRALMQDSFIDLEGVIADRIGKRFGRGQNTAFWTGTGLTGGLISTTTGFTVVSTTLLGLLQASTGDQTPITNLLSLVHSVDPAYRQGGNCVFMMNDASVGLVQKLVSTTGQPLFTPAGSYGSFSSGLQSKNLVNGVGGVDTLLGYPIIVNNDMPSSATTGGAKTVLFGDFHQGYIIRDVTGSTAVLRLEERYADFGAVGFIGYTRCDGVIDDPTAIRALADHA